jgi:NAD(P)-dependent dehydrogenase (short-subunit alcohol dehydrogenase family)
VSAPATVPAPVDDAVDPVPGDVRPVGRFRWEPMQIESVVGISDCVRGKRILVLGGSTALAGTLVRLLGENGAMADRLAPSPDHAPAEQVADLLSRSGIPDGVIDLNIAGDFAPDSATEWEAPLAMTLALLQGCHTAWLAEKRCDAVFYVAVTRMDGHMGFGPGPLAQPLGGLWAGLAKGLPRELPNCNIRIVDLSADMAGDADRAARTVCGELYRWGLFEVGHRDGRRYTLSATPRTVPSPRTGVGPGDTVVMSGGGRGIGFALALDLATQHGCRVVVTGRGPAPDATNPVIAMSEQDFREHRDRVLRRAAQERRVPAARAQLAALAGERTIHRNLTRARSAGADIRYFPCDITDAADVGRLIDSIGGPIAGVIHNAGIDVPVRLPGKDWATVRRVVRVKIVGLLNLLAALPADAPPRFFCSVGSLTGRWGGMVGQLDYGAANEGLARLGLWAGRRAEFGAMPVTTVAWPTWDRLGMITNYQATLKYMTAMDVGEGVRHWKAELFAGDAGEVTFVGDVGAAVVPGLLRGYPAKADLPGIERLRSILQYMGEPVEFVPYRSFSSRVRMDLRSAPCAADAAIAGRPALPVSVCLEHLAAAAEWVRPDNPDVILDRWENVRLRLPLLAPAEPQLTLTKCASGAWDGPHWRVHVELSVAAGTLATADAVYRPADGPPGGEPVGEPLTAGADDGPCPGAEGSRAPVAATAAGPSWTGHAFPVASWCRHDAAGWHADVGPDHPQDLFLPPTDHLRARLGFTAVENLYRASVIAAGGGSPTLLRIASMRLGTAAAAATAGNGSVERLTRYPGSDGDRWTAGPPGRARLLATGVAFERTEMSLIPEDFATVTDRVTSQGVLS